MAELVDLGDGLTVDYGDDYETTYYYNGKQFIVNGLYEDGEAWINDDWYTYTRDSDSGEVVLSDKDDVITYKFEDTDAGWAAFVRKVLG